jgi:hypothetical protein
VKDIIFYLNCMLLCFLNTGAHCSVIVSSKEEKMRWKRRVTNFPHTTHNQIENYVGVEWKRSLGSLMGTSLKGILCIELIALGAT